MIFKFVTYRGFKGTGSRDGLKFCRQCIERPRPKKRSWHVLHFSDMEKVIFLFLPVKAGSRYPPVFGLRFLAYYLVKAAGPCFPLAGKSC
jgi:hypothetical protein